MHRPDRIVLFERRRSPSSRPVRRVPKQGILQWRRVYPHALRGSCLALIFFLNVFTARAEAEPASLIDLSLEELLKVNVTTGTLGGTERRKIPATLTTITHQDIKSSGARDLFELLEVHVPNLLMSRHVWEASHIGIRGIMSERDNKYLLLVNGKVMNELTHAGAFSERDLMTLGDIEEVRVIRGPGAAVYGAGAISGVIEIKTFNAKTFIGTEGTIRAGAGEEFYTAEIKSGHKLAENAHLFLYAGITHRKGADAGDAPIIPGISGQAFIGPIDPNTGLPINGRSVRAGRPSPYAIDDKVDYRGLPPLKFHGELSIGELNLWARYTRGGEVQDFDHRALATHGFPWMTGTNGPGWWWMPFNFGFTNPVASLTRHAIGYQQFSSGVDFNQNYTENWEGQLRLGFDMTDYERRDMFTDGPLDAHREDKINARYLLHYHGNDSHSPTLGFEYQYATFGLSSPGYPGGPAIIGGQPVDDWKTDTWSFLAEDRWDIHESWTLFGGMRLDKNDYTDFMFSPRIALVVTPTANDTAKLILSQATKPNFAEELRQDHVTSGRNGETERLRAAELAYQRQMGAHWSAGLNTFFHNYRVIGYDNGSQVVGEEDVIGVEGELAFQSSSFRLALSHGYTTLLNFSDGSPEQAITAEPYGYGSDLNHWSAHITKLHAIWAPIKKLHLSGSLRVFWGFPGSDDFRRYSNDAYATGTFTGVQESFVTDPAGYNPYNKVQLRLNLGATYDISKNFTVGLHGYNLLGLVDDDFNNRLYVFSSQARREAVSVALSVTARF